MFGLAREDEGIGGGEGEVVVGAPRGLRAEVVVAFRGGGRGGRGESREIEATTGGKMEFRGDVGDVASRGRLRGNRNLMSFLLKKNEIFVELTSFPLHLPARHPDFPHCRITAFPGPLYQPLISRRDRQVPCIFQTSLLRLDGIVPRQATVR